MTESDYDASKSKLLHRLDGLFTEPPIPYRHQHGGEYDAQFVLRPEFATGEVGVRVHIR